MIQITRNGTILASTFDGSGPPQTSRELCLQFHTCDEGKLLIFLHKQLNFQETDFV